MTAGKSAPALVADCGGLVRQIALAVPAAFFQPADLLGGCRPLVPLGNLIEALPADIEAFILLDDVSVPASRDWIATLDKVCSLRLVTLDAPIVGVSGPWIQDMFHVRLSGACPAVDRQLVCQPGNAIARCLAKVLDAAVVELSLGLVGGNQLVGADFRLIGHADLVGADRKPIAGFDNLHRLDPRPISVFGYRLQYAPAATEILLDHMHQFGFHIDQYISLTGLQREGRPLLLVAEPSLPEPGGSVLVDAARTLLQASVRLLTEQGFAVIRNAVPFVIVPDSGKRLPRLYNNVIVENAVRPGRLNPIVWVPQFGDVEPLQAYDAINCGIWEGLGFETIPVAGWSHLASRNGALRCASKVLRRSMD